MKSAENFKYFSSPEERFSYLALLYDRIDQNIDTFHLLAGELDWRSLFSLGLGNSLFGFYYRVFKRMDSGIIPDDFFKGCRDHFFFSDTKTGIYFHEIKKFDGIMRSIKREYVLSRGYAYYYLLYDRLPVREFNDIDVYVKKEDVPGIIKGLVDAGYTDPGKGRIKYFLSHHIHIRVENPQNKIVFEIHWAVDHKYNLARISVEDILQTRRHVLLNGEEIPVPSIDMDFILSSVHALKHSPLLKYLESRDACFDILFKSNYAVKYLDLCRFLSIYSDKIDWNSIYYYSKKYYCDDYIKVVVRFLNKVFGVEMPCNINENLREYSPGRMERYTANYLISRTLSNKGLKKKGFLSGFMFRFTSLCNRSLIFNPVRMMDLYRYFMPPSDYIAFLKAEGVSIFRRNRIYLFLRGGLMLVKNLFDAVRGHHDLLLED